MLRTMTMPRMGQKKSPNWGLMAVAAVVLLLAAGGFYLMQGVTATLPTTTNYEGVAGSRKIIVTMTPIEGGCQVDQEEQTLQQGTWQHSADWSPLKFNVPCGVDTLVELMNWNAMQRVGGWLRAALYDIAENAGILGRLPPNF